MLKTLSQRQTGKEPFVTFVHYSIIMNFGEAILLEIPNIFTNIILYSQQFSEVGEGRYYHYHLPGEIGT